MYYNSYRQHACYSFMKTPYSHDIWIILNTSCHHPEMQQQHLSFISMCYANEPCMIINTDELWCWENHACMNCKTPSSSSSAVIISCTAVFRNACVQLITCARARAQQISWQRMVNNQCEMRSDDRCKCVGEWRLTHELTRRGLTGKITQKRPILFCWLELWCVPSIQLFWVWDQTVRIGPVDEEEMKRDENVAALRRGARDSSASTPNHCSSGAWRHEWDAQQEALVRK